MTLLLDTTLLHDSGTTVLELGPDALGDDFASFLGAWLRLADGRDVLVLPAGQRPDVSDSIVRQLLQRPARTAGDPS